jgi:hypothetical protein
MLTSAARQITRLPTPDSKRVPQVVVAEQDVLDPLHDERPGNLQAPGHGFDIDPGERMAERWSWKLFRWPISHERAHR